MAKKRIILRKAQEIEDVLQGSDLRHWHWWRKVSKTRIYHLIEWCGTNTKSSNLKGVWLQVSEPKYSKYLLEEKTLADRGQGTAPRSYCPCSKMEPRPDSRHPVSRTCVTLITDTIISPYYMFYLSHYDITPRDNLWFFERLLRLVHPLSSP